jgi:hypothetical protein
LSFSWSFVIFVINSSTKPTTHLPTADSNIIYRSDWDLFFVGRSIHSKLE